MESMNYLDRERTHVMLNYGLGEEFGVQTVVRQGYVKPLCLFFVFMDFRYKGGSGRNIGVRLEVNRKEWHVVISR